MIENRPLSGSSRLVRLQDASCHAALPQARPGQFAMLSKVPTQHLLRRPMSIHDEGDGWRSFMIKPVGPASTELAETPLGGTIEVSPPFGNGFDMSALAGRPVLLVGGGFGIAPLHFVARQLDAAAVEYRILYGGRTAADVELDVLTGICGPVLPSTEDGSRGFHGTCVELALQEVKALGKHAADAAVLTCGSHAMMEALYKAVRPHVCELQVSLEEIMACGVGVCMGCVCRTRSGYVPICTQGPVFRADEVFDVASEVNRVEV